MFRAGFFINRRRGGNGGGGALGVSVTGDNILVVAIGNGSDATGTKGSWSKPFLTVPGANAVAVPGDRVIVVGDLDERNFPKDEVDYDIWGNVSYTGGVTGGIIDDSVGTGSGAKIVSTIRVSGNFTNDRVGLGTRLVKLEFAASIINLTSNEAFNLDVQLGLECSNGAVFNFHGSWLSTFDINTGGKVKFFSSVRNALSTAFSDIDGAGSTLEIDGDITNSKAIALSANNDANVLVRGDVISTSISITDLALKVLSATVKVEGKVKGEGTGALMAQGLLCESISGTNEVEIMGGVSNVGGEAVRCKNNSLNVILHKRIESKLDTVNGHGIFLEDNGNNEIVLQSCTIICANAGAKSVFNDGHVTNQVAICNGANVSNVPKDVDIDEKVSNILENSDAR